MNRRADSQPVRAPQPIPAVPGRRLPIVASTEAGTRSPGRTRRRSAKVWLEVILLPAAVLGIGCGIAPRNFRAVNNASPIVRARSVGYGDRLPEDQVVPALIERLNDSDPVVRLTAHEELRRKTGQDFGFVPWARPEENVHAIEHWRHWWGERKAALARTSKIP